jgi:small subunit ribosomal protein S6
MTTQPNADANRHYEIVFLVHPDQSSQIPSLLQRYRTLIENNGGKIHRQEDWGRRQLAYPIQKTSKANYILMNIECNGATLDELKHSFRFNDAILRNLILARTHAITAQSAIMAAKSAAKPAAVSEPKAKAPEAEVEIPEVLALPVDINELGETPIEAVVVDASEIDTDTEADTEAAVLEPTEPTAVVEENTESTGTSTTTATDKT